MKNIEKLLVLHGEREEISKKIDQLVSIREGNIDGDILIRPTIGQNVLLERDAHHRLLIDMTNLAIDELTKKLDATDDLLVEVERLIGNAMFSRDVFNRLKEDGNR